MSEILFPHKYSRVRLVNPANAEIFESWLSQRCNSVRLVNPESAEMLDIVLFPSLTVVRFVAVSSPVKSVILASCAVSVVNVAISVAEIVAPDVLPSADSILARRFESGMFTAITCVAVLLKISSGRSVDFTSS